MKLRFIQDLKVYANGSFWRGLSTVLFNTNYHAIVNYRIAHALKKIKLIPICKLIMAWNRVVHAVDIDYRADLAGGFMLIHGIGVVIGKDVKTTGSAIVYQNVTLGGNNGKERTHDVYGRMTQPVLEENAKICAGACVFGPAVIGRGATVGAMTVCTHDIPEGNIYYTKSEHIMKEI